MIDYPEIIAALKIEKCVNKAYGLSYFEQYTVFVENTLPGDIVNVQVLYRKKNVLFAKVHDFITFSPISRIHRCKVSSLCGGCEWVNISYTDQCNLKNLILEDIYWPLKDKVSIASITPSPKPDEYRNKSFMPVSKENGDIVYGMFERSTHHVIPHEKCLLHPALFNEIADEVIAFLNKSNAEIYNEEKHNGNIRHIGIRYSAQTNEILLVIVTKNRKLGFTNLLVKQLCNRFPQIVGIIQNIQPDQNNIIIGEDDKILFGRDYIFEQLADIQYKLHYKSFFQVNSAQALKMYEKIKECSGTDKIVLDAYSGVGSIGLFLASVHKKMIFIESHPEAHQNAIENAELNHLTNTEFHCANVEDILPQLLKKQHIDLIIFDPPRKGIDPSVLELTAALKIPKIIYMSCNPSTQVRDINILLNLHYQLKEILPFDMFPHTWHIESIAVLEYSI